MENPYESPTVQPQIRESMRSLWKRRLVCPHCHEARITVGSAFFCHPCFKIRCPNCHERSKVKLPPEVWWKRFMLANVLPISIALAVLTSAVWADQNDPLKLVDVAMFKWFGSYWYSINFYARIIIRGSIVAVILLTPLILAALLSIRVEIRLIADHSILVPVPVHAVEQPSGTKDGLPPE